MFGLLEHIAPLVFNVLAFIYLSRVYIYRYNRGESTTLVLFTVALLEAAIILNLVDIWCTYGMPLYNQFFLDHTDLLRAIDEFSPSDMGNRRRRKAFSFRLNKYIYTPRKTAYL